MSNYEARQAVGGTEVCLPSYYGAWRLSGLCFARLGKLVLFMTPLALITVVGGGCAGEDAVSCDEIECEKPAECDDSEGDAICVCPPGYRDVNQDGSKCEDIDECAEDLDDCAENAICTNTEGGYDCACPPAAYSGDGKQCKCAAGYSEVSGKCLANDGTQCRLNSDCVNGHCVSGVCCAVACDRPGECETSRGASCADGRTCVYPAAEDGSGCEDGNACTASDSCVAGSCVGGRAPDCDDGNPCTDDSCDSGSGCVYQNNTDECDDDNACTVDDACEDGECVGDAVDCDDDNPCTDDSCDPDSGCEYENNEDSCDDGDACTTDDTCDDGECVGGDEPDCDDENECTEDSCDDVEGCVYDDKPDDTPCDDGNACTPAPEEGGSGCHDGRCVGLLSIVCDDGNPCTDNHCDPSDTDGDPCYFTDNTAECEDGDACTVGESCVDGACVGGQTRVCDDENPCTNDGCDPNTGCTVENIEGECDDGNPCTVDDRCVYGECKDTKPRVCDDSDICTDNRCDPTDTDGDPCHYDHNSAPCNDNNPCTETAFCSEGDCTGDGNTCGPNSTSCNPGPPKSCVCEENYFDVNGYCVPNTNECTVVPALCDENAVCNDPSNDPGDYECTCNFGFKGDGKVSGTGCTDINECANDPCGISDGRASACLQPEPGVYTCSCIEPMYMEVDAGDGPTCGCNFNGTYAIRIETLASWEDIDYIEDGEDTNLSWAILNQNYLPDGTLRIETIQCGGTVADLCSEGNPIYGPTNSIVQPAFAQFTPIQAYPIPPILPTSVAEMSLPLAFADQPFLTPLTASLVGISLDDPFGEWPPSRRNIAGGGGTRVNGAAWANHDNDSAPAVTSYVVPPGGSGSLSVDPPFEYGATSPACPRSDPSADRSPYWWFPSSWAELVKRFHIGTRLLSQLSGTIRDCGLIEGDVIGPNTGKNAGQFLAQVRFHSCVRCEQKEEYSDCPDQACNDFEVLFYDNQPQDTQTIESSTFIIKSIPADYDCGDVRGMSFE
ncbi:MAG: hypothetical protein JXA30_05360 [Deltaproteobacteria bacterium]|nr:hypothetical protein [Deltaproteobacteria bacterium]